MNPPVRLPRRTWQQALFIHPLRPLFRLWFRPRVSGLENVPRDRPVIFVAKHPRAFLYLVTMVLGLIGFWARRDRPLFRPMEQRNTSIHRAPLLGWIRRNVNSVEATEEAIYNSMFRATTVTSRGRTVPALPLDQVREILARYGIRPDGGSAR